MGEHRTDRGVLRDKRGSARSDHSVLRVILQCSGAAMADFETWSVRVPGWTVLRRVLPILAAIVLWVGCGSDVIIIARTNLGTVGTDASCSGNSGEFPLHEASGLVVIIIISSDSSIFLANGLRGECRDVTAGSRASVRGTPEGERIRAEEVRLL
jgi:hypothetical protein